MSGSSAQLSAVAGFPTTGSVDVTDQATWSTSNELVARFSDTPGEEGLIEALGPGAVVISAGFGGRTGTLSIEILDAALVSVTIMPVNPMLALGTELVATATGVFGDASHQDLTNTVLWETSDPTIVTVSNLPGSAGRVSALDVGTATLTATEGTTVGQTLVEVTEAVLVTLAVTPPAPSLAESTTQPFTAVGTFSDSTTQDLTDQVAWTSSDIAVATVSQTPGTQGLATAVAAGASQITALLTGISGSATLTVTAATLVSIDVAPANPTVPLGLTAQLTATGIYSDSSTQDLTSQTTWSSTDDAVATIDNANGSEGLATTQATGNTTLTATFGGVSGSTSLTVAAATLSSIEVTPVSASLALGLTQPFCAMGTYSDGSTMDLTTTATWSSADGTIALISNANGTEGVATTLAIGNTVLSATLGGVSGTTSFAVTAAILNSIAITPANASLALGLGQACLATGTYSDNSTQNLTTAVTWSSSSILLAVASNAPGTEGLVTTLGLGSVTLTATLSGISASTALNVTAATLVSVDVTPAAGSLALGLTQQFTATGVYSDASTQDLTSAATWSSANGAIAVISNAGGSEGLASTLTVGSTTLSATFGGVSGSTMFTVTAAILDAIEVTPANASLPLGLAQSYTATGTYSDGSTLDLSAAATWSSSDNLLAVASNAPGTEGLVTAVGLGNLTLTATLSGISGSTVLNVTVATLASIEVTPAASSLALGLTQQFTAIGVYSDASTQDLTSAVTWSSANGAIAIVSNAGGTEGLVTTLAIGIATMSATVGGVSGSTPITVTAAILDSIEVTPTNASLALGLAQSYVATGIYSDSSTQDLTTSATWSSSDNLLAVASNAPGTEGLVTSLGLGTLTLTATLSGISGSTALDVTAATLSSVSVTPAATSLALGLTQQFTAMGILSDASTQDLTSMATWSCTDNAIAIVSNAGGSEGLASTLAIGNAAMSATFGGLSDSTPFTVTAAILDSIEVTPANAALALGLAQAYSATGVYSDGSTQDLTAAATWGSSNNLLAVASNAPGTEGLVTALGLGNLTLTATLSGVSGSTVLDVTAAILDSVSVTPAASSVALGLTQQFTATGIFSDASTQDLTSAVTWSSAAGAIAVISNAGGSEGLASTLAIGNATISATSGGVSGSTPFSVTAAILDSIEVTPANASLALGLAQSYSATGVYSDGSTQDLTAAATWGSSDNLLAVASNAPGTEGLVTTLGLGSLTLTATLSGISGSTTLDVTAAILSSVHVTPATSALALGLTQQFTATGTFSDASTQDVTDMVVWTSSNALLVLVSNAGRTEGLALTLGIGTATVTATFTGIADSAAVTVTAATLDSIEITPGDASIALGTDLQLSAIGTYSDGSTQDLTADVTWGSSNLLVASISNAASSEGLVSSLATGGTIIATSYMGLVDLTTLTVTPATLDSIEVTPLTASLPANLDLAFTAVGNYSDGSTQDLTGSATWASSDPAVATISNASGLEGLAVSLTPGLTQISATSSGVSGFASFTVSAATLSSIDVTPLDPSILIGSFLQFTATGNYSDATTQDLTTFVTWSATNNLLVSISNATGSEGLALMLGLGSVRIDATFVGVTGSSLVQITLF